MKTALDQSCQVMFVTTLLMLTQTTRAEAQQEAPSGKLPDGYIHTPGGFVRHHSCVHQVPSGASVDRLGNVFVDGKLTEQVPACNYPTYRSHVSSAADAGTPMLVESWPSHSYEWAEADINSNNNPFDATEISLIEGNWSVPYAPTIPLNNTPWLALWIGLQDSLKYVSSSAGPLVQRSGGMVR